MLHTIKNYSRTDLCGQKIMLAALRCLSILGGSAKVADIRSHVLASCSLDEWERTEVNGRPRWQTFLSFFSTRYASAGYIVKKRGWWDITEEGAAAVDSVSPSLAADLFESANKAYYSTPPDGGSAVDGAPGSPVESSDLLPASPAELSLEEVKEKADAGFVSFLESRNPYEFQELTAALLRAMGFFTPFVAPKGRDGGIDILAFRDPLGASSPRLKVQVKHYPSNPVSVEVVRQLVGLLTKDGDAGVVVTSGSFTSEAHRVARESHRNVRLIDGAEFVSLWLDYYSKMPDADRALMPVVPVFFVGA